MKTLAAVEADTRVRVLVTRVDFGPGKLNGAALARMLRFKRQAVRSVFVGLPENRVHAEGNAPKCSRPDREGRPVADNTKLAGLLALFSATRRRRLLAAGVTLCS